MMFERYSWEAKRCIFFASWEARQDRSACIETLHLLLGLCHDADNQANKLYRLDVWYERFKSGLCPSPHLSDPDKQYPPLSKEGNEAIFWTTHAAAELGDRWIDTGHLLAGLVRIDCMARQMLSELGITRQAIIDRLFARKRDHPIAFWFEQQRLALSSPHFRRIILWVLLGIVAILTALWLSRLNPDLGTP